MKDKTSTLTGEKLAEWTARAQRWELCEMLLNGELALFWKRDSNADDYNGIWVHDYRPDINAWQAMELVKKLKVAVGLVSYYEPDGEWIASLYMNSHKEERWSRGVTPEIAICRAVVVSVFGEYVEEDVCI